MKRKRATSSAASQDSARLAEIERQFCALMRHAFDPCLEGEEIEEAHRIVLAYVDEIGPARASAIAMAERAAWQRHSGYCAWCGGVLPGEPR